MTKPAPAKHQTTSWKAYNAELKARGALMIWLDRNMCWHRVAVNAVVLARDFERQVAELQVRAAILNRFTSLGSPTTVPMP